MAFDPNTAKLIGQSTGQPSSGGFDPSTASLIQPEQQAPGMMSGQPEQGSLINNPVMGAIAGLSNAGANAIEGVVDAGAWLFDKLNIISPQTAQAMKDSVQKDMDEFFRSSDRSPAGDIPNQARMNNPIASSVAQAAGEVGILAGLNPTSGLTGTAGKIADTALQSGTGALVGAGLAGPKTEDQDNAALWGAAIPPVLQAAGAGVKATAGALANKFGLADELRSMTASINKDLLRNNQMDIDQKAGASILSKVNAAKEIENQNYNQIKTIPGTVNPVDVSSNIQKLTQNKSLNGNQLELLSDLQKQLDTVTNMEGAIALKQTIGRYGKNFLVPDVSESTYKAYRNIATSLDDAIENRAKEFGLEGQWKKVNQYHKDTMLPLSENGAMDIADAVAKGPGTQAYQTEMQNFTKKAMATPAALTKALKQMGDGDGAKIMQQAMVKNILDGIDINPKSFDNNAALRKVNVMIDRFKGVDAPDVKDALKGIKTVLEKHGITEEKVIKDPSAIRMMVGSMGAGIGQAIMPGPIGATIGASVGFTTGPAVVQAISKLLASPGGMMILKGIGQEKPWAKQVSNLLRAGALDIVGNANRSPDQQPPQ